MSSLTMDEFYRQEIRARPPADRLRLLALLAGGLAAEGGKPARGKRNIMEFHGLGAELWKGVDAQQYVNELRKEWDERP